MGAYIDLTGQQFGRWSVISPSHVNRHGKWHWFCRCSCGKEATVNGSSLRNGGTKSCGCLNREVAAERRTLDLKGQRFGRLIAERHIGITKSRDYLWLCKCDCGNECIVRAHNLMRGNTKSCGCYHKYKAGIASRTHGQTHTRLYKIHRAIIQRCYNTNNPAYSYYGEKGVILCEEWHDFITFKEWADTNGYKEDLTIDRIDGNKNYEPNNCRWIPFKEQSSNVKSNVLITYKGETKTLAQWSRDTGIKAATLAYRIRSDKWSVEQALTTPVRRCGR